VKNSLQIGRFVGLYVGRNWKQRLTRWKAQQQVGGKRPASLAASGGLDRICGILHKYSWTTRLLEFRDGHEVRRLHQRG
jgi:transposase